MKLRLQKDQSEMKDCTFHPNIDHPERRTKHFDLNSLVDKLYKDGLAKIIEKKEFIKKHAEEILEKQIDPRIMTFKPSINPL